MRPLSGGDGPSAARPPSRNAGAPSSHVPTTFFMRSAEDVEHRETPFGVQSLADHLEAALDSKHIPLARRSLSRPSHESSPPSQPSQSPKPSHQHSSSDHLPHYTLPASTHHPPDGPVLADPASFPQLVMPSIQMPSRRPFTTKGKAMGKLKVLLAGQAAIGKTSLIRSMVQLCEDIVHVDFLSPSSSTSHAPPQTPKSRKRKPGPSTTSHITETHASTKSYPTWWSDVQESRLLRRRKSSTDAVLERNICFVDTPGYSFDNSKPEDIARVVDYVENLLYQTTAVQTMDDGDLVGLVSGGGGIAVDVVLYLLPPSHDISSDVEFMQRLSAITNVIPVIAKSDTLSSTELIAVKTSILARLQTTSVKPFFFGNAVDDALLAVQELSLRQPSLAQSERVAASEPIELSSLVPTHPYAVSSQLGSDTDNMDASLLMSSDYVQPLLPSELAALVDAIFDPESIAWLRHSAAKKLVGWRRRANLSGDPLHTLGMQQQPPLRRGSASTSASMGLNGAAMHTSSSSSIFTAASPSGVLVPHTSSPFYPSNLQSPFPASSPSLAHTYPETLDHPPDFSLARLNNAAHGEQRLADVRLAKWATDLQRSLRNEKDRYEELQRSERAKWLLERVGEEVASGNIVASPGGSPRADWAVVRHGDDRKISMNAGQRYARRAGLDSRDPLGLCDFSDEVKRRGYIFVKVLGGVSVLGAVMVSAVRTLGWEVGLPEGGGLWKWFAGQPD